MDDAEKGGEIKHVEDAKIRRVVICSGKVYYDLYEDREKRGVNDIYLLRVEQLYPVPLKTLVQVLERFKKAEVVWCQKSPATWVAGTSSSPIWNGCSTRSARPTGATLHAGRAAAARRRPPA